MWLLTGVGLVLIGIAIAAIYRRKWEVQWQAVALAGFGVVLVAFPYTQKLELTKEGALSIEARVDAQELFPSVNGQDPTIGWLILTVAGNPLLDDETQQTVLARLRNLGGAEKDQFLATLKASLKRHDIVTTTDVLAETLRALGDPERARRLYSQGRGLNS
mgnify:CR=1 FL=1